MCMMCWGSVSDVDNIGLLDVGSRRHFGGCGRQVVRSASGPGPEEVAQMLPPPDGHPPLHTHRRGHPPDRPQPLADTPLQAHRGRSGHTGITYF